MTKQPKRRRTKRSNINLATLPAEFYGFSYERTINAPGKREIIPFLVSQVIPYSVIRSQSLAFDPFHRFRVAPQKITVANRTRIRKQMSVLDRRTSTRSINSWTTNMIYNGGCGGYSTQVVGAPNVFTTVRPVQPPIKSRTLDTTSRTREYLSEQGEFEHFTCKIYSPNRSIYSSNRNYIASPGSCGYTWTRSFQSWSTTGEGSGAILSDASITSIRTTDTPVLTQLMQKHALGLLEKVLPERRKMTLFRSVIELKDLPRSILTLRKTVEDLITLSGAVGPKLSKLIFSLRENAGNIPKEWLSYHFSWAQTYRDVTKLLVAPEQITREISRLIAQRGKPITTRTSAKYAVDSVSTPSFAYDAWQDESNVTIASTRTREVEFRMMTSAVFDFPTLAIPTFRASTWYEKLGLVPRPSDLYHLVPWTWLYDWFTGLGDYVDAIDAVNHDRSTINFGFLTGTLSSRLTTVRTSTTVSNDGNRILPAAGTNIATTNRFVHTSIAESKLIIRKDIARAYGVKSITAESGLTPFQLSILGALLATRRGLKS